MVFFTKDAWVWMDHPQEAWLPVQLKEQNGDKVVCVSQLGEVFTVDADKDMPVVQPSSLTPCDNMVQLEELNEGAILHNLRMRYEKDSIYTYISSILISVNPFKMLPIYSPKVMDEYRVKMANKEHADPHVYALADDTFRSLVEDRKPQSVIISGESGAGKTEATKLVLQYLAEMSGQGSAVEQQLLQANPIMEAFGNAKTVRNNNSSRFGKWIEVVFDNEFHIRGARIRNYLLEKSRIVGQGPDERNYHVFYGICAGSSEEEKKIYEVENAKDFVYCSGGDCFDVEGLHDDQMYNEMRRAMDILDFSKEEVHRVLSVLAAVMHLGNLQFTGGDKATITASSHIGTAARLLHVEAGELEEALCTKTIKVVNEWIKSPLDDAKASDGRDALAKALYGNMFDWLIKRINVALNIELEKEYLVGVLDIFGFEIFATNRFEQFCINYANEKLQQHFNHYIFTIEQAEYVNDKIDVAHVDFIDNQACLDLIEATPAGLLSMVDEEIRLPKGSDDNLLSRMDQSYENHDHYTKRKLGNPVFTVEHYAGAVVYTIDGFLEKNRDTLEQGLVSVISKSSDELIKGLLADKASDAGGDDKAGGFSGFGAPTRGRSSSKSKKASSVRTLGSQFKSQLSELMTTLHNTDPHFIRCIKPNSEKVSDNFDSSLVSRQLRYLGIQEVVKIRQLGYPVRSEHKLWWNRYRVLREKDFADKGNDRDNAVALLNALGVAETEWRVGETKVFLRSPVHSQLEKKREVKITTLVIRVQALIRGRIWRFRYKKHKELKDRLVEAMTSSEDHEELEAALEDYENMEFNLDLNLIRDAKTKAKRLYELNQAKRALEFALESRDESLLRNAIEGADRVGVDASLKVLKFAQEFLDKLLQYKTDIVKATEARDAAQIKAMLELSVQLGLSQDSSEVTSAKAALERLDEEARCKEKVAAAIKARTLEALAGALEFADDLKYTSAEVTEARALVKQLEAENAAVNELRIALEQKNPDTETLENAIATATAAGVGDHEFVGKAKAKIAEIEAAIKAAKDEAAARKAKVENAVEAVKDVLDSDVTLALELAIRRSETVQKSMASEDLTELKNVTAKAQERITVLKRKEAAKDKLREAAESRSLDELKAAMDEAKNEGIEGDELARAVKVKENIESLISAMDAAAQAKDVEALSKNVGKARLEFNNRSAEWQYVAKFQRKLNIIIAEKEAKAALQVAMRSRTGSMLQVAILKAKEVSKSTGVALDDDLVKEAEALDEEVQQEEQVREQEMVAANRRVTMNAKMIKQKQAGIKRRSIIQIAEEEPERKESRTLADKIKGGFSYADKAEYELYLFPGLRAPASYAKGKVFGKKALKAGMLFFTKDVIPTSLTKIVPDVQTEEEKKYLKQMVQIAIQLFKSVQGFMGDRHYSFQDGLANQVLNIGLKAPLLRDEIYMQIIKQLKRNPSKDSILRGWQLMALACETFSPSDECLGFLLHFIQGHAELREEDIGTSVSNKATSRGWHVDRDVREYSEYCITALSSTIESPPRSVAPDIDYITTFRERVMATGKTFIYFLDGSATLISIDPTSTVEDALKLVAKNIGLSTHEGFGIYEIVKGQKAYCAENSHILEYETAKGDVRLDIDENKKNEFGQIEIAPGVTRFLFKKRMYMGGEMAQSLAKDPVAINIMYHQAVDEVTRGNFCLPIDKVVELAALHEFMSENDTVKPISSEYADKNIKVRRSMTLRPPASLFTSGKTSKKQYEDQVKAAKAKLSGAGPGDYLQIVSQYPVYGAQFYTVTQTSSPDYPKTMVVGVNMSGIFLLNWNSNELLCHFPIQGVAGWKGTQATFVVRVQMELVKWFDSELASKSPKKGLQTLYLSTAQGKAIANLVRAYVDALVAHMKALNAKAKSLK